MKNAVLEFQPDRVKRQRSDLDAIDILKELADLRTDLEYIEKAINAVERLAVDQLGEDMRGVRKKKARTSKAKRTRSVLLRMPQTGNTK